MAELTDQQKADALGKEKRGARADRALNMAETTAKVGGRAMQAEGMVAETMGKVGKPVARATQKGGESIMEAGGELSSTGLGAIVGVPLAVLGAGVTGVGYVGQGLAEGAEKQGQMARRTGGQVVRSADNLKKSRHQAGHQQGLMNRLHLRASSRQDNREDTRSLLGALRSRARQNMPQGLAKAEQSIVHAVGAPVRMATGEALKQSWIHLISSWGLTAIYINIHAFGRLTAGSDFFCKLGHEWGGGIAGAGASSIGGKASQAMKKKMGDNIGVVENIGLGLVDLIMLIVVIAVAAIVALIYGAIAYPLSAIGRLLASLFS